MGGPGKYGRLILNLPENRKNIARYMWSVFTGATQFRNSDYPSEPFIIDSSGDFPVSESFDDMLSGHITTVADRYDLPNGLDTFRQVEPLACAFYLMNGLHEGLLPPDALDRYGRYPYAESIQYANNITEINYVQEIFDSMYLRMTGHPPSRSTSTLFWTHDIDYLFSAWKNDLILAKRTSDFSEKIKCIRRAFTRPGRWNNIERLLALERQYGIRSTFFWLTERGKATINNANRIDHADYDIRSAYVRKFWRSIDQSGSANGLHKSAFETSFQEELRKIPFDAQINRNHFLKFRLPDHFDKVERAGLQVDASLGFAEHHGFRNSFGQPFRPYNLAQNRPYHFLEFPLHLMDTTFLTYLSMDLEAMIDSMIHFIDQHRYSCTISLLLHNTNFNFTDPMEMKIWHRLYQTLAELDPIIPLEISK